MPKMSRVQEVVLPILRAEHPDLEFTTWGADIDYRTFPFVNIRRVGGESHETRPTQLAMPVIEMTAYGDVGLPECEDIYQDCLETLYEAVKRQTQTPAGYLHSIKETLGMTQFSSLYMNSWRVQGLIRLGVRPPRPN